MNLQKFCLKGLLKKQQFSGFPVVLFCFSGQKNSDGDHNRQADCQFCKIFLPEGVFALDAEYKTDDIKAISQREKHRNDFGPLGEAVNGYPASGK